MLAIGEMMRDSLITPIHSRIDNPSFGESGLYETRIGIMIHLDASGSDTGSLNWFGNSDCKCVYHWIVMDDGRVIGLVQPTRRSWHAGKCRPSGQTDLYQDANSAFYGLAAAATIGDTITPPQLKSLARVVRDIMEHEGWSDIRRRLTGHSAEAWPRGRKTDPECNPDSPVLTLDMIIEEIARE